MSRLLKKLKETPESNLSKNEIVDDCASSESCIHEPSSACAPSPLQSDAKTIFNPKIALIVLASTVVALVVIFLMFVKISRCDAKKSDSVDRENAKKSQRENVFADWPNKLTNAGNFISMPSNSSVKAAIDDGVNAINELCENFSKRIMSVSSNVYIEPYDDKRKAKNVEKIDTYIGRYKNAEKEVSADLVQSNSSATYKNREIQSIVDNFKITGLRLDGKNSKIMIDGDVYYINSIIQQKQKIKLVAISSHKLVFSDEKGCIYERQL